MKEETRERKREERRKEWDDRKFSWALVCSRTYSRNITVPIRAVEYDIEKSPSYTGTSNRFPLRSSSLAEDGCAQEGGRNGSRCAT